MKIAIIGAIGPGTTILPENFKGEVIEVEAPRGIHIVEDKFVAPLKYTLIEKPFIPPVAKRKGHQRPYKFHR